jgi:nucleotide-binding universal stress UspA family protein
MQDFPENRFRKCTLAAPYRILVATDMTDTDYLVPHAVAQAKTGGAQITLVHAVMPSDLIPIEAEAIPYIDQSKIDRDIRLTLLGVSHRIEAQGISCDSVVRRGYASDVIREELSRTGATRLIMGTHGRGKLGQVALGSVAHDLLSRVKIPIFVVGPHARDIGRHATPQKILHPVSLMGDYREGVQLALDIAQTYRAELTLLHVLDRDLEESINPERTLEWAQNALDALIPDGKNLVPPVHTLVKSGRLAEEILTSATQTGADWIVLGADGGHRFWSFQETAAYKVLTNANCPVLTLRHEPYRAEAKDLEDVHLTSPLGSKNSSF